MNAEVPDPVYVLWKEDETFHSLQFTNEFQEDHLLTGTETGQVLTWNLRSGRPGSAAPLNSGTSTCLSLHSVNSSLVTQNKNGLVKIWSAQNNCWTFRDELKLNYFGFCKVDVSERLGGIVACPKEKSGVEVFNVGSRKKFAEFQHVESGTVGEVMACKIVNKNETMYLLAVYEGGDVAVWDFRTLRIVSQLKVTGSGDCPMAFDYNERSGKGMCGSNSDKVVVFKTDERMELSPRHEFRMKSEGVGCVKMRPDGKVFAVGSWDGKVRLFASKTCRPLAVFNNHSSTILDMAFSTFPVLAHDSKHLLATSSKDGKISLLNILCA